MSPRASAWLSLAGSLGTLVCCALPLLLVTLGFGAAVAALTSSVPFIVVLSEQKAWVFVGSAAMLVAAAWLVRRPAAPCPADPALARLCGRARDWNRRILWVSVLFWVGGFFAAYLLLPLWQWLDA